MLTENTIHLTDHGFWLRNVTIKWELPEVLALEADDGVIPLTAKEEVLKQFRKFNIDLTPKVYYADM